MDFLTVEEAADRLGVSVATVRRRAASGDLTATKTGKQWLIDAKAVAEQPGRRTGALSVPPQIDLKKALWQVHGTDMNELWVPDILRCEDQFKSSDQVLALAASRFNGNPPGPSMEVDVAKTAYFTRSAALLQLEDRVAYQAAVGSLASQVRALTPETVFSARVSDDPRYFLMKGTDAWLAWHRRIQEEVEADKPWMIKTDLVSYFDHIPHGLLLDEVSSLNPDPRVIEALREMLSMWAVVPGIGIPQGPNASRLLGNMYLFPVDRAMANAGYNYYRYMDDIRIIGKSKTEVISGMRLLEKEFRRRGLFASTAKTALLSGEAALRDESHPDRDMAQYLLDAHEFSEARSELKKILRKALKNTDHVDTSSVKFSLWRLTMILERSVLRSVLENLQDLAPVASVVAAYLRHFMTKDFVVSALNEFFSDPARSYSTFLSTWLFAAMLEAPGRMPNGWTSHAERYCKDRNQPPYLRAITASVLARSGRPNHISWIKAEAAHEWDPSLLRGYAVALHWVGELDDSMARLLRSKSQLVGWTVDYLDGRRKLPSLLDRNRYLAI